MGGPVPSAGPHHGRVAVVRPRPGPRHGRRRRRHELRVPRHRHRGREPAHRGRRGRGVHGGAGPPRPLRGAVAACRVVGLSLPPPPGVAAGEDLEGGVDAGAVAGGEQVEQQAARRPPARGGRGSGRRRRARPSGADSATLASSQCCDVVVEQRPDRRRRPGAPARRGRRTGARSRPGPGRPGRPTCGGSARRSRRPASSPMAARRPWVRGLHLADDREQEAVLGAEVVQQHAVARPDRLGDAAQALVGQALGREVRDHRVEEALPGAPSARRRPDASRRLSLACPPCTKWYIRAETDRREEAAMAQQVIDETVTTRRGPGVGVRAPGGRLDLARVVAHRLVRARSSPGTGRPRAWARCACSPRAGTRAASGS